jgi:hypothetical protein
MDGMLQTAQPSGFDAAAAALSLLVSLAIAVAAALHAPRDNRTRVFLAATAAGAFAYVFAALQWFAPQSAFSSGTLSLIAAAFCLGSVATFHFTQVFPWRRPWIRAHRRWLLAAYVVPPLPAAALASFVGELTGRMSEASVEGAGGLGAVSVDGLIAIIMLLGLPLLAGVGLVLPFAGLMSLVKSWREAKTAGLVAARITTGWILISQLAGGVLGIVVMPLLHMLRLPGLWLNAVSALFYASALLMPLAFAAGIWKYRVLEVSTSA